MSPFLSRAAAAALACTLIVSIAAAEPPGPLETVKRASDQIVAVLSDPQVPRNERWTFIAPVIRENFDFLSMSQSVLSQEWKRATPQEQRRFTDYFSQYIEGTYRSKIEDYSGQRIEYTGETVRGDRAAVQSVIHAGSTQIPVGYYLRRVADGSWRAYDVTIEGVSLVNSYRETYAAIAKSSGIDGVLSHVERRVRELRASGEIDGAGARTQ